MLFRMHSMLWGRWFGERECRMHPVCKNRLLVFWWRSSDSSFAHLTIPVVTKLLLPSSLDAATFRTFCDLVPAYPVCLGNWPLKPVFCYAVVNTLL